MKVIVVSYVVCEWKVLWYGIYCVVGCGKYVLGYIGVVECNVVGVVVVVW